MNVNKSISHKQTELAALLAAKAKATDEAVVAALNEKIASIQTAVAEMTKTPGSEADAVRARIDRALPDVDTTSLMAAFNNTPSLLALRVVNAGIYNMLNAVFFNDIIYQAKAAKNGQYIAGRVGDSWNTADDGVESTSPYKDVESDADAMMRIASETKDLLSELPRWVKTAIELVKHCQAEGITLSERDAIPTPHGVLARVKARDDSQRERWAAEQRLRRAATPGVISMLGE